jgi:hypothetical protein
MINIKAIFKGRAHSVDGNYNPALMGQIMTDLESELGLSPDPEFDRKPTRVSANSTVSPIKNIISQRDPTTGW